MSLTCCCYFSNFRSWIFSRRMTLFLNLFSCFYQYLQVISPPTSPAVNLNWNWSFLLHRSKVPFSPATCNILTGCWATCPRSRRSRMTVTKMVNWISFILLLFIHGGEDTLPQTAKLQRWKEKWRPLVHVKEQYLTLQLSPTSPYLPQRLDHFRDHLLPVSRGTSWPTSPIARASSSENGSCRNHLYN